MPRLLVNGEAREIDGEPGLTLLDALRDHLGLTGAKPGCREGECGACTVLIDGRPALSCLTLLHAIEGARVTTIEGLARGEELHPVQRAFLEADGFQCGYCTPGQILAAVACLEAGHADTDDRIREWMSGNLCRCAAYPGIVAAIRTAAGRSADG